MWFFSLNMARKVDWFSFVFFSIFIFQNDFEVFGGCQVVCRGLYCVLEVFSSKSKLIIRFLKSKNINLNFPITFGYQKKTSWQLFYDRFPVIEGDLSLALKTKNKSGRCNIHSLGKKKKNTHASLGFFIKAKRMGLTHVRLTNVRLTIFFCFFFIPFLYLKIDLCAFFLKTNCINFVFQIVIDFFFIFFNCINLS